MHKKVSFLLIGLFIVTLAIPVAADARHRYQGYIGQQNHNQQSGNPWDDTSDDSSSDDSSVASTPVILPAPSAPANPVIVRVDPTAPVVVAAPIQTPAQTPAQPQVQSQSQNQSSNTTKNQNQNSQNQNRNQTSGSVSVSTPAPVVVSTPVVSTPITSGTTISAYVTGYSYWDNTPAGSSEISNPVVHQTAGGTGTYQDPITLAVGHSISGGKDTLDYPAGTKFYFPFLQKYVIVEDTCGDGNTPQNGPCHTGYQGHPWVDLYVDGANTSRSVSDNCMDSITGVHPIIENPASTYPVTVGSLSQTGCTMY